MKPPHLPLPPPLRAAEEPSFTHFSVVTRLPDIARRALRENGFSPETELVLQDLIDEIPYGVIRPLHIPAAQAGDWQAWTAPYLGQNWLDVPWFFAEEYFYARILEASGYFSPGDTYQKDPYLLQKTLGLQSTQPAIDALAEQVQRALADGSTANPGMLEPFLLMNLWGNQNDLSMWPVLRDSTGLVGGSAAGASTSAQAHLLANQIADVQEYLRENVRRPLRVEIVLDNAGYELVTDLALADLLLHSGLAQTMVLHAKAYPVFVSDATPADVDYTLDHLGSTAHPAAFAMQQRLRGALADGRLHIHNHPFWTSPLAAWEMPPELEQQIGTAQLVIFKGDANYRRLLGDRHWPLETPFAGVVDYLRPAVLAIRTLKSEIATGIPAERQPAEPDWMINGRWGLIQFAPAHS